MKVLFINLPYYGHIVPTIGLVQELMKRGCEVTYMLPFDWADKIDDSGAKFHGYRNHKQLAEQMKFAYAAADEIADDFDLIIYEQFFFLGKHLAEKHHKPVVRIFTAPAANEGLMREYISKGPLAIFKSKWITKAFTKDIAKNIPLKTETWLDEIIHNPPELNLVYTLRQYQPDAEKFDGEKFKFLGPSVYERKQESFAFEKGGRPVVYISLGTVLKGAVSFFQNCIEAFRNENVDVIISVGEGFNRKRLKRVPSNVHIYSSVPQLKVLEMADVFVTHGGMNSVSEALVANVPMLVIPFVSDQFVNARCVERIGAGKLMEYASVNRHSLRRAVMELIHDYEIRENLKTVERWIEEAPGNSGGAEIIIQYYESRKNACSDE